MATFHGKAGTVEISSNNVAEVVEFSVTENADTAEDTAMGDTARTFLAGIASWVASITCHWDDTDTNGQEAMTIGASVTVHLGPEGDSTGDYDMTGTALIVGRGTTVNRDGVVEQTFELQGTGALSRTTHA